MASSENMDGNAIIHHILTRKSLFLRTAVGVSGQAQPVAANIDFVFICMSLNNNFNLNRLERYLSVAWDSGVTPVIVLTKSDLCENLQELVAEAESFWPKKYINITVAQTHCWTEKSSAWKLQSKRSIIALLMLSIKFIQRRLPLRDIRNL